MLVHLRAVFWDRSCSCCSCTRHHTQRRSRCSWPGAVAITLSWTLWRPQKPSWSSGSRGPGYNLWRSHGAGHNVLVPQKAHLRGPGPVQEQHPHYWKSPAASLFPENTEEEQITPISPENLRSGHVGKVWQTPSLNVSMQTEASESRESSPLVARVIYGGLLVQIPSQIIYWLDFRDLGERVDIRKLSPIWTLLTFRRHSWVNAKITDFLINSHLKVNQCNNFCMATGGTAVNTYSINFSKCNLTDSSSALSNYHH